ncbi:MAG: hypothetical protein QFX31_08450 [Methanothrix sp.]|uniref:hypothetical protein n=1 Tax=Methanothrix sp. TaxID=90426 RepID=UPI0032AEDA5E|nr:hypothetical protein [Methanothrix sp.]
MSGSDWVLYNTTVDDLIEYESCLEKLYRAGLRPGAVRYLALRCSICPLAGRCSVNTQIPTGGATY